MRFHGTISPRRRCATGIRDNRRLDSTGRRGECTLEPCHHGSVHAVGGKAHGCEGFAVAIRVCAEAELRQPRDTLL